MPVSPVNVARVSQNLRSFHLLQTVKSTQLGMFQRQNELATGLRFQLPSQDPIRASMALKLDRQTDIIEHVQGNLQKVNALLATTEAAMQDANNLVVEGHTLALEAAGDTLSPDERKSLTAVVDGLIDGLLDVANRQHLETYLFSGHIGQQQPFERFNEGIIYNGDDGRMQTILDTDLSEDTFTIPGLEFFNAVSDSVVGLIDLDPAVTLDTRISDLLGASGTGIDQGRIEIASGGLTTQIDTSSADTVGDLIDLLNDQMPAGLTAALNNNRLEITGGAATITDVSGGQTAAQLGLFTTTPSDPVSGTDLDPRLTLRSPLSALNDGAGLNLTGGLEITSGARVANIDFTGAETIEDVLNRINQSDIGVLAQIADDGRRIEIRNRVSGVDLAIAELNGTDGASLGILSMHGGTLLKDLNEGLGITTVDGDDIRIVTANGANVDIDMDVLDLSAATLQDVIDLFNAQGGGAITATIDAHGITITDNTAGPGTIRAERLNVSQALDDLGLAVGASGNALIGENVHPIYVNSPFTALLELRDALESDDTRGISRAGQRLSEVLDDMLLVQGEMASTAKQMVDRADRVDALSTSNQVLMSDVRDADLTESIVRFQQLQTALQANLSTASRALSLSLLDFLQ